VSSVETVMNKLKSMARPGSLEGMARYGMSIEKRLGVPVPEMRRIAGETGKDHNLALALWKTGIAEAQIVAALIDEPSELTGEQMDAWAGDFDSWDVCDQVCMNLLDKSPLAWQKIEDWAHSDAEFVKRAAFSLIACLAWHDRKSEDDRFIGLLPLIIDCASDERNYVKKAVNWALRHIGKRNLNLNKAAIKCAAKIRKIDSRAARWIAADAIRELESETVQKRLAKNNGGNRF